jgi:ribosome-binding factor A
VGDHRRPDRVAEAIRAEVAGYLASGARDPRIAALVTVTAVEVTRKLDRAVVYVSVLAEGAARDATLAALGEAAPRLRGPIGRALRLRLAPELVFRLDESVQRAARIETLLTQIRDGTLPADADDDA